MKRALSIGLVVALLGGLGLGASGQELAEDETQGVSRRVMLQPSRALERAKRAEAREGAWVWSGIASLAGGFTSNAFESPSATQNSALGDLELQGEALRRFTPSDRLRIRVRAGFVPYTETSDLDTFNQTVSTYYRHRISRGSSFSLLAKAERENDDAVDINGNDYVRDFGYFSYRVQPTLRLALGELGNLRVSYGLKRKDYDETTGRNSLDWWKHGPKVSLEHRFGRAFSLEASYSFAIQQYDKEPANDVTGLEPPGTPDEKHYFHRAALDGTWRLSRNLRLEAEYAYRMKDDRFQEYESYDDHGGKLAVTWAPSRILAFQLGGSFSRRDYDNRPGTLPGETLEYDRIEGHANVRYELSRNLSLFALYAFTDRDTNRDTGISYRDYTDHTMLSGVTLAF